MIAAILSTLRKFASKWIQIGGRARLRQDMRLLQQSGLFDAAWYLEAYPDVRESGVDPLRHYMDSGWREGRDPGPNFSSSAYLKGNSDVAALGVNPLLHFVEYGHAEGRGTPEFGAPTRSSVKPVEQFGPAAPCVSAPLPVDTAVPWKRAGRISAPGGQAIEVDGAVVATLTDQLQDRRWREIAGAFQDLTSWNEGDVGWDAWEWGEGLAILDAWDAGRGLLRIRWHSHAIPLVVRAVRQKRGGLYLAGEAVVTSELDILDVGQAADLGPILFLFTTPEGELVGTRLLMFPALCRGGLYYAEYLAISETSRSSDLSSVDRALRDKFERLRTGAGSPLISEIIVDVDECDGTQPMFDARYQSWLSNQFGVSISVAASARSAGSAYLVASISQTAPKRARGSALKIHGGMIPSISVLVAAVGRDAFDGDVLGSLIVSAEKPAQPSTHVRVPPGMQADGLPGKGAGLPVLALRQASEPDEALAAIALQVPKHRVPTEPELLFPAPDGRATDVTQEHSRTTWFIWPEQWKADQLADALESLALQSRRPAGIVAIGKSSRTPISIQVASDIEHALMLVKTELVGYLGSGIVLHDRRTTEVLEDALDSPGALTASPEVISVDPRGSGWMIKPAAAADLHRLPRMVLPLADPPSDVWIARTQTVKDWASGMGQTPAGLHLCTSHVTASRLGGPAQTVPLELPKARELQAVALGLLVG